MSAIELLAPWHADGMHSRGIRLEGLRGRDFERVTPADAELASLMRPR